MSEYISNLSEAITVMHGASCDHFGTEHVVEKHHDAIVWEGDVEIFQLEGHAEANVAYGWAWKNQDGDVQYIGILNVTPVDSAVDAVQAAVASGQFG